MMEYHMYNKGAKAGKNVIDDIIKYLKETEEEQTVKTFRWIGFEGTAGTKFTLNDQKTPMAIPKSGSFVTPFDGDKFMPIYSLVFESDFNENIYYII